MSQDKDTTENPEAVQAGASRRTTASGRLADTADGIERVREILLGDVVTELERRLTRLDHLITNRNLEVQHDVRARTGVLEAHVRKELQAQAARTTHDNTQLNDALRVAREENRESIARIELRLARIEERFDSAIARVEQEVRDQLLSQAKTFIEEVERVRTQLRAELLRELGIDQVAYQEEGEHADAWPSPH